LAAAASATSLAAAAALAGTARNQTHFNSTETLVEVICGAGVHQVLVLVKALDALEWFW
jgi:hypothetical protein